MDGETLMGLIIPSAMARAGSVFLHVNKLLSLFAASKPGEASSRKLGAFFNSNAITGSSKPIYSTNPTTTVAMKSQENNENDDVSLSLLYNLSTIQERVHQIQSLVSLSSDVNSVPSRLYCDEEAGASSPNSTISSTISGKRSEKEGISGDDHGELTPDRGYSRGTSDEEEDGGETSRKKLRLSKDQSAYLEETFKEHNTLNPKQKLALAKKLNLTARQVEVWFQNRRARSDISPAHYCKMTLLPL